MELKCLDLENDASAIIRIACGAGFEFATEKLLSNLRDSSPKSICLGAFVDGELVAINAFMAHEVLIGGRRYDAYQSGWSATDPGHQGKGLFRAIINEAKRLLAVRNGAFIFGFPNAVSEPIFLKKLGFARTALVRVIIPTVPGFIASKAIDAGRYGKSLADDRIVRFNQYQNIDWKRHEHPDLVVVEDYTNLVWGVVAERKIPFLGKRKVLLAGGCELNKPQLIGQLLRKLRQRHGVDFVRFTATEDSMLATASKYPAGGERTEPFIHFPLVELPAGVVFDAHVGLKDAY